MPAKLFPAEATLPTSIATPANALDFREQFIRERMYFKNVSAATVTWYRYSFHAFEGALQNRLDIGERIAALRQRGVSATSVNTYLRVVNAYLRWLRDEGHVTELVRIPKLKEELKVLPTLTPEHVQRLVAFRPRDKFQARIWTIGLFLLDSDYGIAVLDQ